MARLIVLDEIHITLLVPRGLPDPVSTAIWAAIVDPTFDADLRRALRRLLRRRPVLAQVRVRVYR